MVCGHPCPVEILADNAVDATTCSAQAPALREHFGIALTSLASDYGMTATA